MTFPAPTRKDHQRFCELDGWTVVRNATGRTGHHITYEKTLGDGRVLRTRVSHPPDKSTYGAQMWGHILRDQLDVDEPTFWQTLAAGGPVERNDAPTLPPGEQIPADLLWRLRNEAGVPEDELRGMTVVEASQRMTDHYVAMAQQQERPKDQ